MTRGLHEYVRCTMYMDPDNTYNADLNTATKHGLTVKHVRTGLNSVQQELRLSEVHTDHFSVFYVLTPFSSLIDRGKARAV